MDWFWVRFGVEGLVWGLRFDLGVCFGVLVWSFSPHLYSID